MNRAIQRADRERLYRSFEESRVVIVDFEGGLVSSYRGICAGCLDFNNCLVGKRTTDGRICRDDIIPIRVNCGNFYGVASDLLRITSLQRKL